MKARSKLLWRYVLCCVASFVALVTPLTAVLIAKRTVYFTTVADVWKVSVGGGICVVLLFLLILGKLHVPSGITVLLFVCGLSWLLGAILQDLFFLSCCALAGKVVDWIFFAPRLRRLRKLLDVHEQADVTAKAVAAVLKGAEGSGRV